MVESKDDLVNPFPRKVTEDGEVFCSNCDESIFILLDTPLSYDYMGLVCTNCGHHEDVSYVRILEVQSDE